MKALQALAAEGKIAPDHPITCLVLGGDVASAQEASLAENFQRLAMNPADECLAFQQLVQQGSSACDITRRFGVTARFVGGRLRLSSLAAPIFEALGSGEISLEVAKAYAATPDHERQLYVFGEMGHSYGGSHPDSIRRMMTQATASASDRRALFVGEEAYLAAGGRIEQELFTDGAGARWIDVALLERLAEEKLAAIAEETAREAGLAWVVPTLDSWIGYAQTEGLARLSLEPQPLAEAEQQQLDELYEEYERLAAALEQEENEADRCGDAEAANVAILAEIEKLTERPPLIPESLRGDACTFLILGETGVPKLHRTVFSRAPVPDEDPDREEGQTEAPFRPKKNGRLPQRLLNELAMQRRDTWMDSHPLPFVAATNFARRLDPAALRRFVFKIELRPLSAQAAAQAFERFFGRPAPARLSEVGGLTPGDFAVVKRQLRYRPEAGPGEVLALLEEEAKAKPERPMKVGF